jgi:gamma-glutamyl-gamma-aminobutyrate hydrolase PuuD
MQNKLYVVGGSIGYSNWLVSSGCRLIDNPDDADTLLFTGGSDISSSIYGHEQFSCTYTNRLRDEEEVGLFNEFVGKKSMVGVCRGHQLLSALCGAKIIQDMSHPSLHKVDTFDGKTLIANSLHHQGVYVPQELFDNGECQLLAWANSISPYYAFADESVKFEKGYRETEALFWPNQRILTTQNHPEMMNSESDYVQWISGHLKNFLG